MGTMSSFVNLNSNRSELTRHANRPVTEASLHTIHAPAEKALSTNSINPDQNEAGHYRSSSVCSTETSTSSTGAQQSRPRRPRSAPGNQSPDCSPQTKQEPHLPTAPALEVNGQPEPRRMAICEANDEAENARRRMRVYQKRF